MVNVKHSANVKLARRLPLVLQDVTMKLSMTVTTAAERIENYTYINEINPVLALCRVDLLK